MNNDMTQYHKHGMSWVGYILRNHGITIPLNQVFKWRIFSARPMGVYGWCRFLRGVSQVLDTPWHEKQLVRRYGRSQCNRRVSEFSLIQEYKSHQNPSTSVLLFSSIIFPDFMSHRNSCRIPVLQGSNHRAGSVCVCLVAVSWCERRAGTGKIGLGHQARKMGRVLDCEMEWVSDSKQATVSVLWSLSFDPCI